MVQKKLCPYCGGSHYKQGAYTRCAKRHQKQTWKKLPKV